MIIIHSFIHLFQVFQNMHPLSVCMSYQRTLDIVKVLSEDHDIEVSIWADELKKDMEVPSNCVSYAILWSCVS